MAGIDRDLAELVRTRARRLFISNDTLTSFLSWATPEQAEGLSRLMAEELELREARKVSKLYRQAHFPQRKTFEGYDFSEVGFPEGYTKGDLMSLAFVERAQDFVFMGPTGRGKTHLAIAVGTALARSGRPVRYFTATGLVLYLMRAKAKGELDRVLVDIARADLLIVDEFGYVPMDVEGARLIYQVISDCYERRSVILTTNIEFSRWGTVLGDEKLAVALVDRLCHHGRLVEFGGRSRRMENALMLGKSEE